MPKFSSSSAPTWRGQLELLSYWSSEAGGPARGLELRSGADIRIRLGHAAASRWRFEIHHSQASVIARVSGASG
jgi:hypothetical protein